MSTTIAGLKIATATDERMQHAVVLTPVGGEARIWTRSASAHMAEHIAATLARDIGRHGFDSLVGLPVAQYRTTKRGRRVLVAA